ncbi:MAG: hypothetical protein JNM56_15440 [Planctomycetia bacterium]|nr:hypothetical protein [Planctomycetia bacterium]
MPIPERLRLQPISKTLLDEMSALCDAIERELEAGEAAEELLQQWHSRARRRCDPFEFRTYWKAVSQETFVHDALNPEPSYDKDAVYSEVRAVLDAVSNVAIPEGEFGYYLGWLEAQFPGANMNDLIYWPDQWFGDASLFREANGAFKPESELSPDQILGYAMAKSGRKLKGAPRDVALPFPMPGERKG